MIRPSDTWGKPSSYNAVHLNPMAFAEGTKGYVGYHRTTEPVSEDPFIVGVALGNRSTKPLYGMSEIEERGSDANAWRI